MDSAKVLKSRKGYKSKKSRRFSNMALIRWSKTPRGAEVDDTVYTDNNSTNPSDDNFESILQNEPTEERVNNDVENVEHQGNTNVSDMEIDNELVEGIAWIGGVAETSVSVMECLNDHSVSATTITDDDDTSTESIGSSEIVSSSSEYCPTPLKKARVSPVDLGNSIFLCQTTQLQQFIDQVNETSICYTPQCSGKLVPINVKSLGLGGCAVVKFSCSECGERMINLVSSVEVAFSRRMACSLAMQVAFIASGCMHAQYNKVLRQGLGISAVSANSFYETIKLLHPIVGAMVTEMCEMTKKEMKTLSPTTVGSWQRAITLSDGAWLKLYIHNKKLHEQFIAVLCASLHARERFKSRSAVSWHCQRCRRTCR